MNAIAILTALADFFTNYPERWTFDAEARNEKNERVADAKSNDAFSFSAVGFFERVTAEGTVEPAERDKAYEILGSVARRLYDFDLSQMNDIGGRECVIHCARTAVRDLREAAQ